MSFDLYPNEIANGDINAARNPAVPDEPGFWHNAIPGAAKLTMQGMANFSKGIDLLGSVGPAAIDALTGTTERQDRYFAEHEQVFGKAVDYWTPGPGEVGTAGRVIGGVLPMLATFSLSPELTLAGQFGTQAQEFMKQGVPLGKAEAASGLQSALLAVGMNASGFGSNWATKALLAGAGVNVAQGIASRAGVSKILEGTGLEKNFNPWDAEGIVIDAILGIGFGTVQHLGEKSDLQRRMTVSQETIDAALTANQTRHLEDSTSPGVPMDPQSQGMHVTAMKQAIDDVLGERPVNVNLEGARFSDRPSTLTDADIGKIKDALGIEPAIPEPVRIPVRTQALDEWNTQRAAVEKQQTEALTETDGGQRLSAIDAFRACLAEGGVTSCLRKFPVSEEDKAAILDRAKALREQGMYTSEASQQAVDAHRSDIESRMQGEDLLAKWEAANPKPPEPSADPLVNEARQRIAERPDLVLKEVDDSGNVTARSASDFMREADEAVAKAEGDRNLFTVAAQCMLGAL